MEIGLCERQLIENMEIRVLVFVELAKMHDTVSDVNREADKGVEHKTRSEGDFKIMDINGHAVTREWACGSRGVTENAVELGHECMEVHTSID